MAKGQKFDPAWDYALELLKQYPRATRPAEMSQVRLGLMLHERFPAEVSPEQGRCIIRSLETDYRKADIDRRTRILKAGTDAMLSPTLHLAREADYWRRHWPLFKGGEGEERTLVIGDTQIPFHRKDLLEHVQKAVEEHGPFCRLVVNGDFFDLMHLSRRPARWEQKLLDEMELGHGLLKQMLATLQPKETILTLGNHEWRYSALLLRQLKGAGIIDLQDIEILTCLQHGFAVPDAAGRIIRECGPIPNVEYVRHSWLVLGDALICHPYRSYMKLETYLQFWDLHFQRQPPKPHYRVMVAAHIHRYGECMSDDQERLLVSPGALCWELPYNDNTMPWTPRYGAEDQGFYMLVQVDGVTDLSRSRVVKLPRPESSKEPMV